MRLTPVRCDLTKFVFILDARFAEGPIPPRERT